jgi:hypothetical protein
LVLKRLADSPGRRSHMKEDDYQTVATGTWMYDGSVPRQIAVLAKLARFACSRYDWENDRWDENAPIPETLDGFVYYCSLGKSGEYTSIKSAKDWADAQPWGPVKWDDEVS